MPQAEKNPKPSAWAVDLLERLALLRRMASEEDVGRYTPRAPLDEAKVAAFEQAQGIELPEDYRDFITQVGEGKIGPDYGIYPLAVFAPTDMPHVTSTITGADGAILAQAETGARPPAARIARAAEMKKPFPLRETYNPVGTGQPLPADIPVDAHLYDGCLELAEIGCGYSHLLIVSGPRRGEVWVDYTAGDGSLSPTGTFREWLDRYLDSALARSAKSLAQNFSSAGDAAKATLVEAAGRVQAIATRMPRELACAAHVQLALGDRDGAIATLADLEATRNPERHELRQAIYAADIREASGEDDSPNTQNPRHSSLALHVAREVRLALTMNPNVDVEVIRVLARDADKLVRENAVRHSSADAALIAAVANDAITLVANGSLELSSAVVLELALRHSAATPALIDAAIEAASTPAAMANRMTAVVPRGAALAKACSDSSRAQLAASPWPEVRHAVAMCHATKSPQIKALSRDPDLTVRAAIAARRDTTPEILERLAVDPESDPRDEVGMNPTTPPHLLARLALHGDHHTYVRKNPRLPPELIAAFELLVGYDHFDRKVDPRDLPEPMPFAVPVDADGIPAHIQAADAEMRHWSFPVAALDALLEAARAMKNPYSMVAYNMATRPWLTPELVNKLAEDPYAYARANIGQRPDIDPSVANRMVHDPSEYARNGAIRSPLLSAETLVAKLSDPVDIVREAAVNHAALPAEHLARAVEDESAYVRRGVACSPNVSVEQLEKLAKDPSELVRRFVVWSKAATPAILDLLANDPDEQTRGRVAFRRAVEAYLASTSPTPPAK